MAKIHVLDSSAILAVIFSEPGGDSVVDLLQGALLSTVNLAEVHARLILAGSPSQLAWSRLLTMGCQICAFDDAQARLAGELVAATRAHGLSFGDRACLALALQRRAIVHTTNPAWKNLNLAVEINQIH